MKKLPDSVMVRGLRYKVVQKTGMTTQAGEECSGICDYDDCIIYIDSDLHPQLKWQVMWHELLHAMSRSHPINEDEYAIDVLAGEIFTVLRQMGFYGKEEQRGTNR